MHSTCRGQKRSEEEEARVGELQRIMGAGDEAQVLCKSSQNSEPLSETSQLDVGFHVSELLHACVYVCHVHAW